MYTPDIVNLRHFYSTSFGQSVRNLISSAILRIWPNTGEDVVVGLGYATPYLADFITPSAHLAACMPAGQGAAYWPHGSDNLVVISHDSELPFAESSINRVLLVHSMENSEQLSWLIQEIWRILTPNGRILAVVPNRRGMWSRSSRSPFGYGRPFSITQMRTLLSEQNFTVTHTNSALFMPPTRLRFCWKIAGKLESAGRFICNSLGGFLGGIILVEAEKQVYSTIAQPVVEARRYRSKVMGAKAIMNLEKNQSSD